MEISMQDIYEEVPVEGRGGSKIGQRVKLSSITVPAELLANPESWDNSLDLRLGGLNAPVLVGVWR